MIAALLLLSGIWTNEEQVRFAEEAGRVPPPWVALRVLDGRVHPIDAYGAAVGEGRALTADEVKAGRPLVPGAELRKARPFACWAAIPKADGGWWGGRDLALHDQGGMARLATDEPVPQRFELRLRNVVWPSGPNRPSLVLYVHEPGNPRAIAYAWANPEATRVGLNLRAVQASCTLAEP
ncbi:hypothetical protein [Thermaurantiacus sp.]